MSDITFDGKTHMLTLTNRAGVVVNAWPANNKTTRNARPRFIPDGVYYFYNTKFPTRHPAGGDELQGEFGTYGIVLLKKPSSEEAWGIGIHSGRQAYRGKSDGAGAYHRTQGCIRTTDSAMGTITTIMRGDPLVQLFVNNNHLQD